jgi:hypothetical protein
LSALLCLFGDLQCNGKPKDTQFLLKNAIDEEIQNLKEVQTIKKVTIQVNVIANFNVSPLLYIILVLQTQKIWYPKRTTWTTQSVYLSNIIVSQTSVSFLFFFYERFYIRPKQREKYTLAATWKQHKQNLYWKPSCFRTKHSNQPIQKPKTSSNCPEQNKQLEQKRGTKQQVVELKHSTIPSIYPKTK